RAATHPLRRLEDIEHRLRAGRGDLVHHRVEGAEVPAPLHFPGGEHRRWASRPAAAVRRREDADERRTERAEERPRSWRSIERPGLVELRAELGIQGTAR